MATNSGIPATRKGPATRDRILEAARRLFNSGGVEGTAVFRIAAELEMSPGNLTYHFRSKSDLVRELAQALAQRLEGIVAELRPPLRPGDVIAHLDMVLGALWSHRFLFNSAAHVAQMDADLAEQLAALRNRIHAMLTRYFEAVIARGEMRRPAQPDGVALLCDNILSLWLHWLQAETIRDPERTEPGRDALRRCMRHYYSLIDPYVGRAFSEESWAGIARRYGTHEEEHGG